MASPPAVRRDKNTYIHRCLGAGIPDIQRGPQLTSVGEKKSSRTSICRTWWQPGMGKPGRILHGAFFEGNRMYCGGENTVWNRPGMRNRLHGLSRCHSSQARRRVWAWRRSEHSRAIMILGGGGDRRQEPDGLRIFFGHSSSTGRCAGTERTYPSAIRPRNAAKENILGRPTSAWHIHLRRLGRSAMCSSRMKPPPTC